MLKAFLDFLEFSWVLAPICSKKCQKTPFLSIYRGLIPGKLKETWVLIYPHPAFNPSSAIVVGVFGGKIMFFMEFLT